MARRFSGVVGYGHQTEIAPGVWDDVITEKPYKGDVIRDTRSLVSGTKVNDDVSVNNSISILADAFAFENIFAIRYVLWLGSLWVVPDVDVERPHLILRLGGIYNGPALSTGLTSNS